MYRSNKPLIFYFLSMITRGGQWRAVRIRCKAPGQAMIGWGETGPRTGVTAL
jgi:hypothetical protein